MKTDSNVDKRRRLEAILDRCESMVFHDLVSWKSVQEWEVGESKEISGSLNRLIAKEANIMIFETVVPAGVAFNNHWHDFREHNFIISGIYKDSSSVKERGRWEHYRPYEKHEISNASAEEELKMIVIFTVENSDKPWN